MIKELSLGNMNTLKGKETNKTIEQLLFNGDRIGDYKVIKLLGAGGMGQVYLVENVHMHKQYALKVLPPNLSQNSNFIDRFKVEARVMADLEHPGIVRVHNIGHDEKLGFYYLAMSYIESGEENTPDLEMLLNEKKKFSEDKVLKITKQLCSALEHAHNFRGKGIVHRDLKPSNVLLDTKGNPHIADFGLAKVIGEKYLKSMINRSIKQSIISKGYSHKEQSLGDMKTMAEDETTTTSLIGTYEYMSPEQQEGKDATKQSDVYSLGLIIYRMLTGRKAKGALKMPSTFGLNEKWDEIIQKCLEHEPEDRFFSVTEIVNILEVDIDCKPVKKVKKNNGITKKEKLSKTKGKLYLIHQNFCILLAFQCFMTLAALITLYNDSSEDATNSIFWINIILGCIISVTAYRINFSQGCKTGIIHSLLFFLFFCAGISHHFVLYSSGRFTSVGILLISLLLMIYCFVLFIHTIKTCLSSKVESIIDFQKTNAKVIERGKKIKERAGELKYSPYFTKTSIILLVLGLFTGGLGFILWGLYIFFVEQDEKRFDKNGIDKYDLLK